MNPNKRERAPARSYKEKVSFTFRRKKMKFKKSIFILSFIVLYCGCKDNLTAPEFYFDDIAAYFPLEKGNYWEYEYKTNFVRAIIKREIKDTMTHKDGSLLYGYTEGVVINNPDSNAPVTGYYSLKDNRLWNYYYLTDTLEYKTLMIQSPLILNSYWVENNDTIRIASFLSIEVNNNVYHNSMLIIRKNSAYIDSTW